MAETFPIGFSRIDLKPRTGITFARERSRALVVSRSMDGVWAGTLSTAVLSPAEYADFHGFCARCVEENLRVDFVHPRFALPRAYTPGSWPLGDDPEVASVVDLFTLSVSGLEVGMTLKRGDRLAILQEDLPPCYRELTADVTVSSTSAQHLPIAPRLPIGAVADAAAVRFDGPVVRLMIVPDSFDGREEFRPLAVSITVEEDGL